MTFEAILESLQKAVQYIFVAKFGVLQNTSTAQCWREGGSDGSFSITKKTLSYFLSVSYIP